RAGAKPGQVGTAALEARDVFYGEALVGVAPLVSEPDTATMLTNLTDWARGEIEERQPGVRSEQRAVHRRSLSGPVPGRWHRRAPPKGGPGRGRASPRDLLMLRRRDHGDRIYEGGIMVNDWWYRVSMALALVLTPVSMGCEEDGMDVGDEGEGIEIGEEPSGAGAGEEPEGMGAGQEGEAMPAGEEDEGMQAGEEEEGEEEEEGMPQ
ncbi:MAG: hypothetical protein ACOCXM_07115, partial [Myxococcota bacterium]